MKFRMSLAIAAMSALVGSHVCAEDQPAKLTVNKQENTAAAKPVKKTLGANKSAPNAVTNSTDAPKSNDRLVLDATTVTGNRELPKVMYIVPWKKADLGNLPGQPFNTLLDETLTPVDRDVFRREVQYYEVISGKDQPTMDQATPKPDSK